LNVSAKQWGLVLFAEALANPILLAIGLIGVAIAFVVGYVVLLALGWVSAVLYGALALGLVCLIGKLSGSFLKSHWYIIAIIPVMAVIGYCSDHVRSLSMIAPAQWISSNPEFALQQASLEGSNITVVMTPQVFGAMLFLAGLAIGAIAMFRYKSVKRFVKKHI
jgi:hypothetical protein